MPLPGITESDVDLPSITLLPIFDLGLELTVLPTQWHNLLDVRTSL